MVRLTEKPKRRAASCCRRLVMNGGEGFCRDSLRSILPTLNAPFSSALTIFAASSPLSTSAFLPSMRWSRALKAGGWSAWRSAPRRSEEHTSELQSHSDLVCRLLLEKKKIIAKHFATLHKEIKKI